MSPVVFILALIIAGSTVATVARAIATAISGRGGSRSELADIERRLEQQGAALDDAHAALSEQSAQLAELQERVDFAERLLAQARDRSALGPGEKRD